MSQTPLDPQSPHVKIRRGSSFAGLQNRDAPHNLSRWSYDLLAMRAARLFTLVAIVYATWHFGAADTAALRNLSLVLGIAVLLALTSKSARRIESRRLPVFFFALIFSWVAYATLQQTTIAGNLPGLFGGITEVREQWGARPIGQLDAAAERLDGSQAVTPVHRYASVNAEETRQALIPFLLAAAAALLSAMLFRERTERSLLLWTVIANAVVLSFWGIVQKASRMNEILPGVSNTFSTDMPFGSFIYKNAGAAALLPALAAVVALAYSGNRRRSRRPDSQDRWGTQSAILEIRNLVLLSLGILLMVGLTASLSRGAWVAAAVAAVAVAHLFGLTIRRRDHLIVAGICVGAIASLIALAGIRSDIEARAEHVSLDYVAEDSRWPQWIDGFATAMAHFPSGSGLGTYGHATLPHQSEARRSWFREAHNQYLEILTESGLVGILILLVGMVWLALVSWRLIRHRRDHEKRSWGLVGVALLVCGGVQSAVDFVLVIPANLILYASLIAVVGVVDRTRSRSKMPRGHSYRHDSHENSSSRIRRWSGWRIPAFAWHMICFAALLAAYHLSSQQLHSRRVLVATSLAQQPAEPSSRTVTRQVAALSAAIDRHPSSAALYQRRANWHLVAYRRELAQAARDQSVAIDWSNTRLEGVFEVLLSQSKEGRSLVRNDLLKTRKMRSSLAGALRDLSSVLARDPLSPRAHLAGCVLAPLTNLPVRPWLESSAALNSNSAELLYLNGLFAIQASEFEIAVDQWSKALKINHEYLHPILELAHERLPPEALVSQLVPPDQPDLFLHLVEMAKYESSVSGQVAYDRPLLRLIVQHLESDLSVATERRHATMARIHHLLGDFEASAVHWEKTLQQRSRHANYRWEYAQALFRIGKGEEALRQAVLGRALNPTDHRFEQLAANIRQQIREGARR